MIYNIEVLEVEEWNGGITTFNNIRRKGKREIDFSVIVGEIHFIKRDTSTIKKHGVGTSLSLNFLSHGNSTARIEEQVEDWYGKNKER